MVIRWLAIAVLAAAQAAHAQGFPERPVKIIVPLTQGGSPDTIARTLAAGLQPAWGQPVVVENRPGGNQNIGAELVAKSAPDGYTWLLTPENVLTVNPHLGKTPFDPFADFTLVMQVARIQFLLVVHPSVPASSVQELLALARAKPGTLDFGSSGNGSPQHLGGAMLQALAGIKMNHVPYKGATQAIQDLLPGRIQVWIGAANTLAMRDHLVGRIDDQLAYQLPLYAPLANASECFGVRVSIPSAFLIAIGRPDCVGLGVAYDHNTYAEGQVAQAPRTSEEAVALDQPYTLASPDHSRRWRMLTTVSPGGKVITVGEDLVRRYLGQGPERRQRFFALLQRPATPSGLQREIETRGAEWRP